MDYPKQAGSQNKGSFVIEQWSFKNGFRYIEVRNEAATARIALQGAHLFHYCRQGETPLLWLSEKSLFETGKAIRGGVPVCWPWFGPCPHDPALPQHGFARTSIWEHATSDEPDARTSTVTLRLTDSDKSLELWPFHFEVLLKITVGTHLGLELVTRNLDKRPFEITSALHSYLAVSDITRVSVDGLDDTRCFDKVSSEEYAHSGLLHIDRETDRVFQDVRYPLFLHDKDRMLRIEADGSRSAVVWNPWKEKSAAMADMPDDGYRTMLCIEAANVMDDGRVIEPGKEHSLKAVLSVLQPQALRNNPV